METYTNRLNKSNPSANALGWDIDWYRNQRIDDAVIGQSMENNFVVSGGNLTGASALFVNIDATVVEIAGVRYSIAAQTLPALTDDDANWVYVSSAGAITVSTSPPATVQYCMIRLIDTVSGVQTETADLRQSDTSGYDTPLENGFQNGTCDIWQRYSSAATIGSEAEEFVMDRLGNYRTATSSLVVDKKEHTPGQLLVPGNPRYYHEAVVTTDSASSEENYHFIRIKDVEKYQGKTIAFKIHGSADSAKDIVLEVTQVFDSASPDVQVSIDTISLTSAFTKNIVYISMPSITGATIGTLSYTEFKIWLSAGSGSNANTNSLGNQSGTFNLAEVEIYASDKELPVRRKNKQETLYECQPYGAKIIASTTNNSIGYGYWYSAGLFHFSLILPRPLIQAPTGLTVNPTALRVRVASTTNTPSAITYVIGYGTNQTVLPVEVSASGGSSGDPAILGGFATIFIEAEI